MSWTDRSPESSAHVRRALSRAGVTDELIDKIRIATIRDPRNSRRAETWIIRRPPQGVRNWDAEGFDQAVKSALRSLPGAGDINISRDAFVVHWDDDRRPS